MLRKDDEPIRGYRLIRFLGRGQFGEVWKTTAPGGTTAALKFIDLSGKQGLKEFRGVQRVKEIRHAHLMPITALWLLDDQGNVLDDRIMQSYDPEGRSTRATIDAADEIETRTPQWLVVAMLLGDKNLQDQLEFYQQSASTGIPVHELLRYMEETAKGIDFLNTPQHDLGEGLVSIQHCDIKPANIMLVGDSILICDFGLARMLGDVATTATGMVGSPAYMAPECIRRKPSNATDQYSLAITYYELRTGALPFTDQSYMAVLDAHSQGKLDFSKAGPEEQEVLRIATSIKPEDRYPTAVEFVHALREVLEGQKPRRGNKVLISAVSAAALLLVAALAWRMIFPPTPPPPPPPPIKEFTLTFDPPDAQVLVNGKPLTTDSGQGKVTLQEGKEIKLIVRSPRYTEYNTTLDFAELENLKGPIRLDHNALYYSDEAQVAIDAGNLDEAVRLYKEHRKLGGSYIPAPQVLALPDKPKCMILGPDASPTRLAVGMQNGSIAVWTWPLGESSPAPVMLSGEESVDKLLITPDGQWLISVGWTALRFYQLADLTDKSAPITRTDHSADITAALITPDGRWLATGDASGKVFLWDLHQGLEMQPIKLDRHDEQVTVLAVAPDSSALIGIGIGKDQLVVKWDLTSQDVPSSGTELGRLNYDAHIALVTKAGQLITAAYASISDGVISSYPVEMRPLTEGPSPVMLGKNVNKVYVMTLSPDETQLATGSDEGSIRIWSLKDPASEPRRLNHGLERRHTNQPAVESLSYIDGNRWLVSGGFDGSLLLWDCDSTNSTPLVFFSAENYEPIVAMQVSPDHRRLVCCSEGSNNNGVIRVWDLLWMQVIKRADSKVGNAPRIEA